MDQIKEMREQMRSDFEAVMIGLAVQKSAIEEQARGLANQAKSLESYRFHTEKALDAIEALVLQNSMDIAELKRLSHSHSKG